MKTTRLIIVPPKQDDTCIIIAQLYDVTDRYVRMVIKGYMPKGEAAIKKAKAIKETYNQYKAGKNNLIRSIERKIKIA